MLFDSSILIDFLNEQPLAAAFIGQSPDKAISVVTWVEVLAGARDPESDRLARDLMTIFDVLPLTSEVAEAAVAIRRMGRLKLPDAIILATARVHGLVLVTRNTRDFPADDPMIRVPYSL